MAPVTRGRFIALEGGEGTGKSTQARLLKERLENAGLSVVLTREPGGTPGSEAIRDLLLDPPGSGWGMRAEALLFAAARADHVHNLIRPSLDEGRWVICDRYVDSSRAYQGMAGGLGDQAIQTLHAVGSEELLPDLTLLLKVPAEHTATRLQSRDGDMADAIGGRGSEYHDKVAEAFARIASAEPDRFATIDGDADIDTVHERLFSAVRPLIDAARPC